jgi:hypothetical protein
MSLMKRVELTLDRQIACVEREVEMRRRVYPRWITEGRISQAKALDEIEAMKAVLATLRGLKAEAEPVML